MGKQLLIAIMILSGASVLSAADFWEGDWVTSGIFQGTAPNYAEHDNVGFIVHTVGDPSKPVIYSFYLIPDIHMGDLEGYEDYNLDGWRPDLDLSGDPPVGIPNKDGSASETNPYPGKNANRVINLINDDYDFGFGNGRFCVVLGDMSVRGEVAEQQHAKIKLDSLDCPWVPVIGNHDTYPFADLLSFTYNDQWFHYVYNGTYKQAKLAFPNWIKATLTKKGNHCPNWSFDWGPNHHIGLDWAKRSLGGEAEPRATLHNSWAPDSNGYSVPRTYPWFQNHLEATSSSYNPNDLLLFAHHPLYNGDGFFDPKSQFDGNEETNILEEIDEHYEWCKTHWFSGHYHRKPPVGPIPSQRWGVGLTDEPNDTVVEVHLFPGQKGSSWGNYYVGLVEVHGDYMCDFDYTFSSNNPHWPNIGDPVTFTSTSVCYNPSGYPNWYWWSFGDGWSSSGSPHIYKGAPEKYFTQLQVGWNDQEAYCSKPVLVGFNYPQWLAVKFSPIASSSLLNSPLQNANLYKAQLSWWTKRYKRWIWNKFQVYRKLQSDPDFVLLPASQNVKRSNIIAACNAWLDDGPFTSGQQIRYRINSKWHIGTDPQEDFRGRDTLVQAPGTPPPPPECPEAYVFTGYDSTLSQYLFSACNTVLAHSLRNPQPTKDLLLLDMAPASYQGFTGVTLLERNTESSVFDEIKLHSVDHPQGTQIATSADGNIYCWNDLMLPWACYDAFDNDYLYKVLPHPGSDSSLKVLAGQEVFVNFDLPLGRKSGILISTGLEPVSLPSQKNILIYVSQGDTNGNWTPLGEAYMRSRPSEWLIEIPEDTGELMVPTSFKLQFSGEDTACINYIALVSLVDTGWTDTAIASISATHWQQVGGVGGEWQSTEVTSIIHSVDSNTCSLAPSEQIAMVFPVIAPDPDTSIVRDYVLESYGMYSMQVNPSPGLGLEETEEIFTYDFDIRQVQPFSRNSSIFYQVPRSTQASLTLYDVTGRLVKTFVEGEVIRGKYSVSWDGTDSRGARVGSGVYFARFIAGEFKKTQKLVIMD